MKSVTQNDGETTRASSCIYDLVIIGGGPAGLASAIYGSADGLRTLLIDKQAPGGQCGRSSCVENFLGFPDGISGQELADRAVQQARKFGCEFHIPRYVSGISCCTSDTCKQGFIVFSSAPHEPDGTKLYHTKSVIVASGLKLKKLGLENEHNCTNVHYYPQMSQGQKFAGKDIHIVGGANSAAQAALYFAQWAKVTLLVRGPNLSDSMSQYLETRLRAHKNIKLVFGATVAALHGKKRCEKLDIVVRSGDIDSYATVKTAALLVYAGADAQTEFVPSLKDAHGYVLTGNDLIGQAASLFQNRERNPFPLESSIPGIFVAGDVRAGSAKGVTAGVGEGATAVKQIHQYLTTI